MCQSEGRLPGVWGLEFRVLIPRIRELLDYRGISFGRYEISSQGLGESLLFYGRDGKSQPKVGNREL